MKPFFNNLKRVKPYFVPEEETEEFAVIPPDSGRREIIDENSNCLHSFGAQDFNKLMEKQVRQ